MPKAFISHATPDRDVVERLLLKPLKNCGVETWYCKDDIRPGDEWVEQINEGLQACDWFVLVLTPQSVASEFVRSELQTALEMATSGEKAKTWIIPVLLQACRPTTLHIRLSTIQHVDFIRDQDSGVRRLLKHFGVESLAADPVVASCEPIAAKSSMAFPVATPTLHADDARKRLVELLTRTKALLTASPELAHLQDDVDQLMARAKRDRAQVLIMGASQRGKTTLMRVLTDDANPAAVSASAITGVPTVLWSERLGFEIIDSPFANENGPAETTVYRLLPGADLVMVVLSAQEGAAAASETNLITRLGAQGFAAFLFVCNKMDLVRERERDRLRAYVRQRFAGLTTFGHDGVYFVSAEEGLEGRLDRDHPRVERSGVLNLEAALRRLSRDAPAVLKPWGVARRLLALLFAEMIPALEALRRPVASSVEKRRGIDECLTGLQAITAELQTLVPQLPIPSLAKPENRS